MAPVGAAAATPATAAAATPYTPTLTANDAAAYGRLFQTLPAVRPGLVSSTSIASCKSVTHDAGRLIFRACWRACLVPSVEHVWPILERSQLPRDSLLKIMYVKRGD